MIGQTGHLVRYHAEEEVVVKTDLAIIQHQLTEEKFALVLQMRNGRNVIVMNARVIFRCLKHYVNVCQIFSYTKFLGVNLMFCFCEIII